MIQLTETYRIIRLDKYNLILEEYKEVAVGVRDENNNFVRSADDKIVYTTEKRWVTVGYYGDLSNALKACIRHMTNDYASSDEIVSIKDLNDKIDKLTSMISSTINTIKE